MPKIDIDYIVAKIFKAHFEKNTMGIDFDCVISSQDVAENIQDIIIGKCDLNSIFWKLGASTYGALNGLKLERTFHAPIPNVLETGHELPIANLRQAGIECEIAIELIQDIVVKRNELITEQTLENCGYFIRPAFEIPETRFDQLPPKQGGYALLADNGAAGWAVLGEPVKINIRDIENETVALFKDNKELVTGDLIDFTAKPLELILGHLNSISKRGYAICAGHTILIGSLTGYTPVTSQGHYSARFSSIGDVNLELII